MADYKSHITFGSSEQSKDWRTMNDVTYLGTVNKTRIPAAAKLGTDLYFGHDSRQFQRTSLSSGQNTDDITGRKEWVEPKTAKENRERLELQHRETTSELSKQHIFTAKKGEYVTTSLGSKSYEPYKHHKHKEKEIFVPHGAIYEDKPMASRIATGSHKGEWKTTASSSYTGESGKDEHKIASGRYENKTNWVTGYSPTKYVSTITSGFPKPPKAEISKALGSTAALVKTHYKQGNPNVKVYETTSLTSSFYKPVTDNEMYARSLN